MLSMQIAPDGSEGYQKLFVVPWMNPDQWSSEKLSLEDYTSSIGNHQWPLHS